MMSSEEMTERVLGRVEAHERKAAARRLTIRRYAAVSLSLCAALIIGAGVWLSGLSVVFKEPPVGQNVITDTSEITEQKEDNINTTSTAADSAATSASAVTSEATKVTESAVTTAPMVPIPANSTAPQSEEQTVTKETEQPVSNEGVVTSSVSEISLSELYGCFPVIFYEGEEFYCSMEVMEAVVSSECAIGNEIIPKTGTESENGIEYACVFITRLDTGGKRTIAVKFDGRSEYIIYTAA